MKVALIIDAWFPFVGGGQINALEISKLVAKNGHNIDIITRNCGKDNQKLPKNLKVYKLGRESKPNNSVSQIIFLIRSFIFLYKKDYDLIHVHAFLPGIMARLLMVTCGIPAILTIHGTSINTKLNNFFKRWLEKFILTEIQYSAQITVSRDFLTLKNINRKVFYIPNGVDLKKFTNNKKIKSKEKTLLFVGRLHPQKNLPNLIKSISIINQQMPVKLIIAGDGPQKQELKKLIKKELLGGIVEMIGKVAPNSLKNYYSKSRLFILPSIYEGFPLTLLEAWSAKLPVVVTKTGECQFLVKDGKNGYFFNDPDSLSDIANTIIRALSSKNLEKIGLAGYNLVKSRFTWEKSAKETLKVYENVLKTKN